MVNQVTEKLTWAEENAQIFGAKMLEVTDNITAVPVWLQAYNKDVVVCFGSLRPFLVHTAYIKRHIIVFIDLIRKAAC